MATWQQPEITYPVCATWQLSVPAIGLTDSDHFHPGSKVTLPTVAPPALTTSIFPLGIRRVSSGLSRLLRSLFVTASPLLPPLGVGRSVEVPRRSSQPNVNSR